MVVSVLTTMNVYSTMVMVPVKTFVSIPQVATNALARLSQARIWTKMDTPARAPRVATTKTEAARTNASTVTAKFFVCVLKALVLLQIGKLAETKTNA